MKHKIPTLDLLKTTRPTSRNDSRQQSHVSFRITLQTPKSTVRYINPQTSRMLEQSIFQNDISKLKSKHRKAKTETDPLVFWDQVQNFGHLRTIEPPKFNQEKQAQLYQKLKRMKIEKEEKIRKEQEERERVKLLEQERKHKEQQALEIEKKRMLDSQRYQEYLAEKYKIDRRFSIFTLVNALMLRKLHSKPTSFKLAKLIANQYLNLLNYKAILHKIKMQQSQPLQISQILQGNAEQLAQLKNVQHRLNEGLILRRKQTRVFLNKQKTIFEQSQVPPQFSEPVLKRIRFLQACLRLKVFKLNKKNFEPKQKVKNNRVHPNRVKALKKRLDDIDFIKANSPSYNSPLSSPGQPVVNPLGLFCTLYKVADTLKNYDRIKTQKMIQKTNDYLVKRVQSLYYPVIRYVSIFYKNVVVWSIQYSDITLDRTCIVLFFKGEGRSQYFYRLDIPIGAIQKEDIGEQNCITVWPTVRDYLMSYLELKGQLALLHHTKYGCAKNYKLNFIQGLSMRSRKNITEEDINAIVETKEILNYLQTSQIVRIRKIFGSVYELLPQFQDCNLLSDATQYILNLPLVHDTILQLRILEQQILEYRRNIYKKPQDLSTRYKDFIEKNKSILNQILAFRFVHNNSMFFQDQMLEDIYELSHKSIYIQCATINIQDILNHYDYQICNQISKYCLISLHLTLKSKFHFDDLLFNAQKHSVRTGFQNITNFFDVDYSHFDWKFKQEYFKVRIEVTVFERDKSLKWNEKQLLQDIKQSRSERAFKPLKLKLDDFCKLGQALQETTFNNGDIQQCNFDQILKSIISEQCSYSQVADLVLKNAFTLDIKNRKIIIQPKYLHILSKTHNFIQKMDHQSLYNKIDCVFKYSVYPNEQLDIRRGYENREKENQIAQLLPFNKLFQDINQIDMRITVEARKIEQVTDYAFDFQDQWSDLHKQTMIYNKYQYFVMSTSKFLFIDQTNFMKIIYIKKNQSPIILYLHDQHLIHQISNCQRMNKHQKCQILTGIIRVLYSPTSFLYLKDHQFYNYLKAQLPNYHQIKVLLVSNSKKLLQFLDRLDYIYILKLWNNQSCYVHVKVYFLQDQKQQKGSEKIYIYDGEHLFVSVELYEFNSKLKKYILLFNKFDLELQFDVEKYFDSNIIFNWCKAIISNTKFDKRFLYRVPQIMKYNQNQSPVNLNKFMLNSFFNRQQSLNVNYNEKVTRCTFNEFPKNNFDQNITDKNYLNTVHRIFRVIGHYIQKFYLIKQKNKKKIVNEMKFKDMKNVKLLKQEFVIISILAHTYLDMFQIIYYFPRSKRKLMTYINILDFQEMDFKDHVIFNLIDNSQFTDYNDLSNKEKVNHENIKKHPQLDMNLIQKIKLMKKTEQSPFDLQSAKQKKRVQSRIGFAQVSNEILMKNKVIKQAINQNNQISDNVMKFLGFSRKLHNNEDNHNKLIEIQIWNRLLNEVFLLNLEHDKNFSNFNTLMDRLMETFEDFTEQKIKIIGKEHLMKRQSMENSRYNYKVQTELTEKFEKLIINNHVRVTQQFKFSKSRYILNTNFYDCQIMEFICSAQFRIERLGSAYVECFLEPLNNKRADILKPLNPMPYSSSSNYNIYFRYYCLTNYFFKDVRVNLRELLNLFIADGFFKSQTNYMNSKLSISDIINMCHYLTYKIKTQNYLNLSQLALQHQEIENTLRKYIITESVDQFQTDKKKDGEGYIYSEVIKKKNKHLVLLQLQLFHTQHKVIVNMFENKTDYFQQKELTFTYIQSVVPNFQFLIKTRNFFKALQRLVEVLKQKQ
ncbi:unnamed protein product [Paramecium pentaurelia]|uniref:Uncharacterized protein n=1 Tax=Paramecium pentaurelia TaxID=43138 RepID=A0A8S1Y592_9CILI|nr:unnamed protein product [Paramecium pentaurelia]